MDFPRSQTPESDSSKALRRAKEELKQKLSTHPSFQSMNFGTLVKDGKEAIVIYWLTDAKPPTDLPKEHGEYPVQVNHARQTKED